MRWTTGRVIGAIEHGASSTDVSTEGPLQTLVSDRKSIDGELTRPGTDNTRVQSALCRKLK